MIVRFYKYDFWIPEQIFSKTNDIFSRPKEKSESSKTYFPGPKNVRKSFCKKSNEIKKKTKFRFFGKFSKFWFFIDFSLENYFSNFSEIFFGLENFSKTFRKNIIKSKICSGIQKSYLENHTSILKLFKIKNPIVLTQIVENPVGSCGCYVHRPSSAYRSSSSWRSWVRGHGSQTHRAMSSCVIFARYRSSVSPGDHGPPNFGNRQWTPQVLPRCKLF